MITVLGLDPGTSNMAWSIVRIWSPVRFKVLSVGMVQAPMRDMKGDIRPAVRKFVRELKSMMNKHNVTHIGAERFQSRGLKGNTGELVAFMLGVISTFRQPSAFITASQWKNNFNKYADLKALYKRARVKPHEIDSCSIGLYVGHRTMGTQDVFGFLSAHEDRYLATIEAKSTTLKQKIIDDNKKAELRHARQSIKKKAADQKRAESKRRKAESQAKAKKLKSVRGRAGRKKGRYSTR